MRIAVLGTAGKSTFLNEALRGLQPTTKDGPTALVFCVEMQVASRPVQLKLAHSFLPPEDVVRKARYYDALIVIMHNEDDMMNRMYLNAVSESGKPFLITGTDDEDLRRAPDTLREWLTTVAQ